jgi:glycosyltransferase involved in cell wall biosynthesis
MRVLIAASHYLPGYKAGGPIRSLANIVARLGSEFDFHIVARDRDLGDRVAYANIRPNEWQPVGAASVRYLPPSPIAPLNVLRAIRDSQPSVLYFNSFFDTQFCLAPLALMRLARSACLPIIIAPRGQFAAGALRFKAAKKYAYLRAFKSLRLTNHIIWQSTSEGECDDIRRAVGNDARIVVAPNLTSFSHCRIDEGGWGSSAANAPGHWGVAEPPPQAPSRDHIGVKNRSKQSGELNLVFFSRVSPKKNLSAAIQSLHGVSGKVTLDILGPVEDADYDRDCRRQAAALPPNIAVHWRGPVQPDRVAVTLSKYDALLLPTFGENFGHAIIESLAAGCPVVISDRTPWRDLQTKGVGWDLPLSAPQAFTQTLTMLCGMDERTISPLRAQASQFAASIGSATDHVEAHRQMFQLAFAGKAPQGATECSRRRKPPEQPALKM